MHKCVSADVSDKSGTTLVLYGTPKILYIAYYPPQLGNTLTSTSYFCTLSLKLAVLAGFVFSNVSYFVSCLTPSVRTSEAQKYGSQKIFNACKASIKSIYCGTFRFRPIKR